MPLSDGNLKLNSSSVEDFFENFVIDLCKFKKIQDKIPGVIILNMCQKSHFEIRYILGTRI
jgi:hypothetical protein